MDATYHAAAIRRLLTQARASGALPACTIDRIDASAAGGATGFEGRVIAHTEDGGSVVAVARLGEPSCLDEALGLRQAAGDRRLPAPLRQALRQVWALEEAGPESGCLLEPLDHTWSMRFLVDDLGRMTDIPQAVRALCDLLVPAYAATETYRVRPRLASEYLDGARAALEQAGEEPLLSPRPLRLAGDEEVSLPPWPEILGRAAARAVDLEPSFACLTLAPDLDRIRVQYTGQALGIRFADTSGWGTGDWLGDLSALTVQLLALAHSGICVTDTAGTALLEYGLTPPRAVEVALRFLRRVAEAFGTAHQDLAWARRYQLGVGTGLLRLAPGLCAASETREHGIVLFAEGLRRIWAATEDR